MLLSDKISNRGLKQLQSEEDNILKNIAYVSKLKKLEKEMKLLLKNKIKSIKFKYQEEECNIKYEYYFFKENEIIKNIEIKDIFPTSFKVFWDIDNNVKNNKKLQYKVEIRKENEDFYTIYEGENEECSIDNLQVNSNYELKIYLFNKFLNY